MEAYLLEAWAIEAVSPTLLAIGIAILVGLPAAALAWIRLR